jgi:hypothetical protein
LSGAPPHSLTVIKSQIANKMKPCHAPGKPAILTRELCDGIARAVAEQHEITDFLECFLMEISPEGRGEIRRAVTAAHQHLGVGRDAG